jgi:hypothetical protein
MGKAVNKLVKASTFGKVDLDPDAPKLPDPIPAADPEDPEALKAESRRLQRRKRTGRTSTVLTEGSNTLG